MAYAILSIKIHFACIFYSVGLMTISDSSAACCFWLAFTMRPS